MDQFLGLTIAGFATGSIYAIAASGLVLTYATTGTFNFAHGAIGMISAFLYWQLRFGWGWPAPLALVIVLLVAAPLFGAALERVIMRRLEGTSETTRLVVTISLLLALLGLAVIIWSPQENRPVRQFFQGEVIVVGGVRIPWWQIVSLAVAALVAVGLRMMLYRTRQGVAMRAAVDNRDLSALNGAEPDRSSMLAWATGCSLAALSGILIAPTLTMSAVPLTLLIVNAYGAAVFGRLRSLPLTFVGAMVVGLLTSYGIGYLNDLPTDVQPFARGLFDAVPAIVLFIVVLALPAGRLATVGRSREFAPKPSWRGSLAMAVVVIAATAMSIPLLEAPDLVSIGRMWGLAIIGLSMVPLIGWAGQLSLAQMALAAIGAVAYAHLGWANPLGLVWAGVVAAITAVIIALPVVRLQGIYVALATAAFAVLCDRWLLVLPEFSIGSWSFTVFQGGTLDVVRPDFLGLDLTGPKAYFVYASVVFAVMMLGVVALRRGTYGIRLIATKEGPAAVATAGINVTAIKLSVFAISGFIAGVGGAVLSGASPANNSTFDFVSGLPVLLMMVIGGISSVGAAVITGIFIGSPLVNKILEPVVDFGKWQNVMIGLAGIGLGKNPNGMTSDLRPAGQQVKANRPVLVAMVAALLLVWVLRVADLYGNVLYVVLTLVVLIGSTIIAGLLAEPTGPEHAETPDGSDVELDDPPELMGLTTPFTAAHRKELDQAIGLDAALARVREELADARG